MSAWNDWYHCVCTTYGMWLPGDPRGFRTRHHREHVEGDYNNPPPQGAYDDVLKRSKDRMKRDAVLLGCRARILICRTFGDVLTNQHVEIVDICVAPTHLHVLARFPARSAIENRAARKSSVDDPPRHLIGIAKRRSAFVVARAELVPAGGVWAKRGKIVPIRDRRHQVNVVEYIRNHRDKGGIVWSDLRSTP